MRIVVVLPQPEGPTRMAISPASTVSDRSWTATVPSAYSLRIASSTIIDLPAAGAGPLGSTVMILPASGNCLIRNAWICGEYLSTRKHIILSDLREHVILTVIAVVIGFALSVPLSLFVR